MIPLENTFISEAFAKDININIGIVQRFGEKEKDQLLITTDYQNTLTIKFQNSKGHFQSLITNRITLNILSRPLSKPILKEYIILSDHATFETAEDNSKKWEEKGIQTEITQPGRWQVWAKRDIYKTPLLRRWLLDNLKTKGYNKPYIESTVLLNKSQATFIANGKKYHSDYIEIIPNNHPIHVIDLEQKKRAYLGSLKLQPNAYGTYTLVNHVPVEVYLKGVVPHEIGPNAPINAIKAQTIIARTYALRNLRRFKSDDYELCANTHCQVYYGLNGVNSKIDKAINDTKNLVLIYQNKLVDALYSSTTGGVTANFTDVWDGEERPYLKTIIDSPQNNIWNFTLKPLNQEEAFRNFIKLTKGFNETGRSAFRWEHKTTKIELAKDLRKYLVMQKHPLSNFKIINSIKIDERSVSGRILNAIVDTDIGIIELKKNEVRSAFGPPRSTLFYLEPINDKQDKVIGYTFIGGGFGHGVGLSQYGSYNLANLGWNEKKILHFYYPGTQVVPLNNSIIF